LIPWRETADEANAANVTTGSRPGRRGASHDNRRRLIKYGLSARFRSRRALLVFHAGFGDSQFLAASGFQDGAGARLPDVETRASPTIADHVQLFQTINRQIDRYARRK
jgi:hypothetical protein